MIKNTTVFLDFTTETAAQAHIIAYANDFGSRKITALTSQKLKSGEHLIVTYYSGEKPVFTQEIDGDFFLPNAVIGAPGEYEAYFAVFSADGVKLTATVSAGITVVKNRVLAEADYDTKAISLYSSLLAEYGSLLNAVEGLKNSLSDITEITVGKNLIDKNLASQQRLNSVTGTITVNSNYYTSWYIAVAKGMKLASTYSPSCTAVGTTWAAYDESLNFLPDYSAVAVSKYSVESEDIKYIRVCVASNYWNCYQVYRTDITHENSGYEEYKQTLSIILPSLLIKTKHIENYAVTSSKLASNSILPTHISSELADMVAPAITENLTGKIMTSSATLSISKEINYYFCGKSQIKSQKITDTVSPVITVFGKNLLDKQISAETVDGITFAPLSNGGIKVSGTSTAASGSYSSFPLITSPYFLPAGTYSFSGIDNGSNTSYFILISGPLGNIIITEPTVYEMAVDATVNEISLCVVSGTSLNKVFYPQIEYGQPSAFSPPVNRQSVTYNGTLCGIEVTESDDYTVSVNGKFYYCDTISTLQKITRICSLTLDGTTAGKKVTAIQTRSDGKIAAKINLSVKGKSLAFSNGLLCTHFENDSCYLSDDGAYLYLIHSDENVNTAAKWNKWLQSNNVEIRYIRSSPEYTSSALTSKLLTRYPYMTATCSDGIAQLYFNADTKRYTDSQISDVLGGSY